MTAPWRTAVFEGAGATLWWDLRTDEAHVDVWDAARAAAWLDAPRETMRQAAVDAWREVWWPASRIADVGPLDPRVVAARKATALAALDGITDDDEATERALRELAVHVARLGPLQGEPAARVRELADDYGLTDHLAAAAPPGPVGGDQEEYALAADGGTGVGLALLDGADPVDPGAVPQGVVDPLGQVRWEVRLPLTVRVTVPAAPVVGAPPPTALSAVTDGVRVPLHRTGATWRGEAAAAAALLTRRPTFRLEAAGCTPVTGVDPQELVATARRVGP